MRLVLINGGYLNPEQISEVTEDLESAFPLCEVTMSSGTKLAFLGGFDEVLPKLGLRTDDKFGREYTDGSSLRR